MKLLVLLSSLCAALPAGAYPFAIYNYTAVQSVTGGGADATLRLSGVLIIDLETDRAVRLGRYRLNGEKRLIEGEEQNFTVWRAQGAKATHTLVVSADIQQGQSSRQETVNHYRGKETLLNLGPVTASLPRTVKGAGYALLDGGQSYLNALSTQTMNHSYSAKQTIAANSNPATTLDIVATHFRTRYQSQGYQP